MEPSVTGSSSSPPPSPQERGPLAEDRIRKVLSVAETPLMPKIVALRAHIPINTAKGTLRRMVSSNKVMREPTGYVLPKRTFEQDLERQLLFDGQKHSLPKVHDVHLTFKPDNLRKVLQDPQKFSPLVHAHYEDPNRGPDSSAHDKPLIEGYKPVPSLHAPPHALDRFFNTIDPMSLYQLWRLNNGDSRALSGGFQETFGFGARKVTVQLYGTGTIKVIIASSEDPMDAVTFREMLARVDGLFMSKTGTSFADISPFFFFELVHFSNDIRGHVRLGGTTKLNCTVQQFDNWLFRVYEKVLGDELYVRSEICLNGNFEDHNLAAMLALLEGNVTPTIATAQIFKTTKDQQELVQVLKRQGQQIHEQGKQIHDLFEVVKTLVARGQGEARV